LQDDGGDFLKITCGTDIVEIGRIKKAVEKSVAFAKKVFTTVELDYCDSKKTGRFSSMAARFAAKEAVAKALGSGFGENVSHNEIEIINDKNGKPHARLSGGTLDFFNSIGAVKTEISLSHGRDYAVAFAVITYRGDQDE
jgi:holo-[acyl-carrier protein] synthase